MRIEIHLYASLTAYKNDTLVPNGFLETDSRVTVGDIIRMLTIPENDIRLIFVNGKHSNKELLLKDGDRLALFPPVGGG